MKSAVLTLTFSLVYLIINTIYREGNYVLKDLESTNGTRMSGTLIKQADLRHGDKFRVGDTTLQFILEDTGGNRIYEIK